MGARRSLWALGASVAAVFTGAALASPAQADFHLIKVKEITGEASGSNTSFIELQMYSPGQTKVAGHDITIWDQDALILGVPTPVASLPLTGADPLDGQSQRTILVGDIGVAGRDSTLDLSPYFTAGDAAGVAAAGAACFEAQPIDCVSWGSFTGAANLPDKTTPIGLILGAGSTSFTRSVAGGACPTALEAADDTNNAAADFTQTLASPTTNATAPLETLCPPAVNPKKDPPAKAKKCKKKKKKGKKAGAAAKKCKKKKKK